MYFTIWPDRESSPALPAEAEAALGRLRDHAEALAGLSPACSTAARTAGESYRAALAGGDPAAWRRFVSATAALLMDSADAFPTLAIGPSERAAHAYLEQIVRENADLLDDALVAV